MSKKLNTSISAEVSYSKFGDVSPQISQCMQKSTLHVMQRYNHLNLQRLLKVPGLAEKIIQNTPILTTPRYDGNGQRAHNVDVIRGSEALTLLYHMDPAKAAELEIMQIKLFGLETNQIANIGWAGLVAHNVAPKVTISELSSIGQGCFTDASRPLYDDLLGEV